MPGLPRQLTRLVGRDHDLDEIGRLVVTAPLVTLTGAGGVGKTRLALAAAAIECERFPFGAYWVELGALSDAAMLVPAVAAACGVSGASLATLADGLAEHTRDRGMLLVLDNCEHFADACAALVARLLQRCPTLKVLDAPEPVGGWAAFIGRPHHWQAWSALLHTVRTGETAFDHIHGQTGWEYRTGAPAEAAIFDRAMAGLSRRASPAILEAFDFSRFGMIVDVGGGKGALLAAILAEHSTGRRMLVDLPRVDQQADLLFRLTGMADRCEVITADFFATLPGGGDAYVLKSVLHDWPDEACVRLLRMCRQAMCDDATLLVIERALDARHPDADIALSDLEMLVGNGGRERTVDEYAALLHAAGLHLHAEHPTPSGFSLLEARGWSAGAGDIREQRQQQHPV